MSSSTDWKNFDPIDSVRRLTNFFKWVGIWPVDIKNRFLYFGYIIYGILLQLTFTYVFTGLGITVVETNARMMTEQIFDGLAEIAACIRLTNFIYYFREASNFLTTIKKLEVRNQEECQLYKKRMSLFVIVTNILVILNTSALIFSSFSPFLSSEIRLAYPGWYPLDWSNLYALTICCVVRCNTNLL